MQLELTDDQRMLAETVDRFLAKHASMARFRDCEPVGFDADLWRELWQLGLPTMRVPGEECASLIHAILVVEQAGRHLASAPLAEAIAVQRLLGQLRALGVAGLDGIGGPDTVIALADQDIAASPSQFLSSGAVAGAILGLDGEGLWLLTDLAAKAPEIHGSIPACRLSDILVGNRVRLGGRKMESLFGAAREEFRLLTAAQVAAAGARSLEIGAAYASERVAFGRRIGEFQGISHPLADSMADLDGARLLCWRAADGIARRDARAGALVAMAAWWSGVSARQASLRAMRTLGGYGMAMDYDPQAYWRRINAWSLAAGSPDMELDRIAARLWDHDKVDLPDAGDIGIDFGWGPEGEAAAARMRAFCDKWHDGRMARFMRDSLDGFDRDLNREMAGQGLLYADAPVEYGGPGQSATAAAAIRDTYGRFYWNLLAPSVTDMVAKTLLHFGSDEARSRLLPDMIAGNTYCTLAYSEPSGGSDIFAVRTTATKAADGSGDWLINGQKMFTSTAHLADYALMIARTGPDKYRGITLFVVPLKQAGFDLAEIRTIGDERTNVTFYSDVRVPDAYRIGEVDGGLKVLAAALTIEQASGDLHVMSLSYLLEQALAWARDEPARIARSEVRRALARTATCLAVQDCLNRRAVWAQDAGCLRKHQGPMAKLFGSEAWLACGRALMEAAAPDTLVLGPEREHVIEFLTRRAIPATIYAGSSEIQRSLIAEAGLGLPRSR